MTLNPMSLSRLVHPQDASLRHHSSSGGVPPAAYTSISPKLEGDVRYAVFEQTRDREETWSERSEDRKGKGKGKESFGYVENGRYYCTFIHYGTKARCASWEDGYTTWYDLARHADTDHGPEEVDLIDQGRLGFATAQWVTSEERMINIKNTVGSMVCRACGTTFASNRFDSMDRHVRKGACERLQQRQMLKNNCAPVHKKKGGKSAAEHTRR